MPLGCSRRPVGLLPRSRSAGASWMHLVIRPAAARRLYRVEPGSRDARQLYLYTCISGARAPHRTSAAQSFRWGLADAPRDPSCRSRRLYRVEPGSRDARQLYLCMLPHRRLRSIPNASRVLARPASVLPRRRSQDQRMYFLIRPDAAGGSSAESPRIKRSAPNSLYLNNRSFTQISERELVN